MQVLLHLGLNKCASTFVQQALDQSRQDLLEEGVWYPGQTGESADYGLSNHYGFGPDHPDLTPTSLTTLLTEATDQGCNTLIVSSEYLSLYNPAAVKRITSDLARVGVGVKAVIISRDIFSWVRSLFNQYVKSVEGGPPLGNLDAFIAQVLKNRSVDVARRVSQWAEALPPNALEHYRLPENGRPDDVLIPFETFTGCKLVRPDKPANPSIDADRLYEISKLRCDPASHDREQEITRLLGGGATSACAPQGYLDISYDNRARLMREVCKPYYELPVLPLPRSDPVQEASSSPGVGSDWAAASRACQTSSVRRAVSSGIR